MINHISFENYKAFEAGALDLRPITIVLGANSTGKSSILQLILLFAQSFQSGDDYAGAFKLNSKYVSLGEGINILRDHKKNNELCVKFDITKIDYSEKQKITSALQEYAFVSDHFGASEKMFPEIMSRCEESKGDIKALRDIFSELKNEYEKSIKIETKGKLKKPHKLQSFLKKEDLSELSDLIDMCANSNSTTPITGVGYRFFLDEKTEAIHVKEVTVYSNNAILISYSNRRNNGYKAHDLKSDLFEKSIIEKNRVTFGRSKKIDGFEITGPVDSKRISFLGGNLIASPKSMIEEIFNITNRAIESKFRTGLINHVSPLRGFPQRYYMIDQSYTRESLNTKEGDSLADALKRNPEIKRNVNTWLNTFNLAVDVEALKDIIHSIKINQNDLHLDLTDVGFGISQVLPVIVQGFLSKPSSITIIEQPEIHLHPKMQAELADLFIDIVKQSEKVLLIETHSEALLKRLRRRISEGSIPAKDVAIYFVSGKSQGKKGAIRKIEVEEKGAFEWPKDFTETEIEDTIEFMKNQKND